MTREELGDRIRQIITEHLGEGGPAVTDASALTFTADGDSLELDSLDMVEITMDIEVQLDLPQNLDDGKVEEQETVGDLIAYVAGVVGVTEAAA